MYPRRAEPRRFAHEQVARAECNGGGPASRNRQDQGRGMLMADETQLDALTAELMAADVAYQLGKIVTAQHRISVALASAHRAGVLRRLSDLGISEAAADAYAGVALSADDMDHLKLAMAKVKETSGELRQKVRAIAVAGKE